VADFEDREAGIFKIENSAAGFFKDFFRENGRASIEIMHHWAVDLLNLRGKGS
jgi:hypothetical protein